MCRDQELAVPGTYDPKQPIVKIDHIQSSLQVITSKQRPRKLSIFGMKAYELFHYNLLYSFTYNRTNVFFFERMCSFGDKSDTQGFH